MWTLFFTQPVLWTSSITVLPFHLAGGAVSPQKKISTKKNNNTAAAALSDRLNYQCHMKLVYLGLLIIIFAILINI